MATPDEYTLQPGYLALLDELTRWFQSGRLDPQALGPGQRRQPRGRVHVVHGHLLEDLDAAADPLTSPATARFMRYTRSSTNPSEFVEDKEAVCTNRSDTLTGETNGVGIFVHRFGEWWPLRIDAPASGGSGGSGGDGSGGSGGDGIGDPDDPVPGDELREFWTTHSIYCSECGADNPGTSGETSGNCSACGCVGTVTSKRVKLRMPGEQTVTVVDVECEPCRTGVCDDGSSGSGDSGSGDSGSGESGGGGGPTCEIICEGALFDTTFPAISGQECSDCDDWGGESFTDMPYSYSIPNANGGFCVWFGGSGPDICGLSATFAVQVTLNTSAGTVTVQAYITTTGEEVTTEVEWEKTYTVEEFVCCQEHVLTKTGSGNSCTNWPATLTVTGKNCS